jgi:hypothetical protein
MEKNIFNQFVIWVNICLAVSSLVKVTLEILTLNTVELDDVNGIIHFLPKTKLIKAGPMI